MLHITKYNLIFYKYEKDYWIQLGIIQKKLNDFLLLSFITVFTPFGTQKWY